MSKDTRGRGSSRKHSATHWCLQNIAQESVDSSDEEFFDARDVMEGKSAMLLGMSQWNSNDLVEQIETLGHMEDQSHAPLNVHFPLASLLLPHQIPSLTSLSHFLCSSSSLHLHYLKYQRAVNTFCCSSRLTPMETSQTKTEPYFPLDSSSSLRSNASFCLCSMFTLMFSVKTIPCNFIELC
uniref:uncharacterized protein LOC122773126 isoform X2 n=1 Tax=Solea senegalensis TaxID=28829 RepID=UPI001CD8BBC2|nr:uncharacterized protein LOC122773126 isoform X2 [Solea senegalensis]